MEINIATDKIAAGREAAKVALKAIEGALRERGEANLILATGASQFEMLGELVRAEIDWENITCFHLDEYLGLPNTHPASFRRYLRERFVEMIDGPREFHWIAGDAPDAPAECGWLGDLIRKRPIDVACIGIGENGHLAFNDPPADFDTDEPYLIVELDEACRKQQLGEGWFPSLEDVPTHAISMSVRQIMKSSTIVCTVPDERKANAVQSAAQGPVTPQVPASILQEHPQATLFLDAASASLLQG